MPLLNTVTRGNTNGPTVVFVHGWPDTDALFEPQYKRFGADYKLVSVQLPLYTAECRPTPNPPFFGYSLEEVRDMLIETLESIAVKDKKVPALVAHDWGCVIAYIALAKKPALVSRIVALDIGLGIKAGIKEYLFIIAYQWTLISLFLMPSFIGTPATRAVARLLGAPHPEKAHSGMNFLYLQTWKNIVTGNPLLRQFKPPTVPILFMYGTNKPCFFHSKKYVEYVKSRADSKVVEMRGGHWFFVRSATDAANTEIESFLKAGR